jgi:exodeoxyribonuclease VII small subunit
MSPASKKELKDLSYEQAFAELETVVNALEGEQRPLDEAIALYERGQALAKHCAALLEKAELKVRQLSDGELAAFEGGA